MTNSSLDKELYELELKREMLLDKLFMARYMASWDVPELREEIAEVTRKICDRLEQSILEYQLPQTQTPPDSNIAQEDATSQGGEGK